MGQKDLTASSIPSGIMETLFKLPQILIPHNNVITKIRTRR